MTIISTCYKILLTILQLFSFLPIAYNSQTKQFKRSILIQIYSIIILSIFCFFSSNSIIRAHLLNMKYCKRNCIEAYISTGSWILCVTPLYSLLYQSIFNIKRLVKLANAFLSFYRLFEWTSLQWNMVFIIFTFSEFLVLPIINWIFLKLLNDNPDSLNFHYTVIFIIIPLLKASTSIFCLPVRYCSYFIVFLNKRLNDEINIIIFSKESQDKFDVLDKILLSLLKIQIIIPNISQICAPVLCMTLIIVANNLSWTYFHMLTSFVIQKETKLIIAFMFVVLTESLNCIKIFWLIIFPCDNLKNEISETMVIISNINCTYNNMMTSAFRRKVSRISRNK